MRADREHGGDLSWVRTHFPHARTPWIDLSTGINPHAYPVPALDDALWQALPDAQASKQLHAAAAEYFDLRPDWLLAAPGTQALIQWLPFLRHRLHGKSRVAVLSPTYNEHLPAWQVAGHETVEIATADIPPDCHVVVLTNPNNPDGRLLPPDVLATLAVQLRSQEGWLVIDEAYVDANPALSFCQLLQDHPNVIVLRSFGKFFGLAGLRLGFVLAQPSLLNPLQELLGPWAVSAPACAIGAAAMRDSAWIAHTRQMLAVQGQARNALLKRFKITLRGTHPLFCLLETLRAADLFEQLAIQGLYVRRFADHPTWLRIGAIVDASVMERFEQALKAWSKDVEAA